MHPRHVLLATLVAAVWGFNFVVIDIGLDNFPPLLFAALRFVAAALPAVLFLPRPPVAWRWFVLIGLTLGVGQFGLLFIGMHMGMPAGLSSLVLQTQALFTILFAGLLLRERVNRAQVAGMVTAFTGMTVIGIEFGARSPLPAFALCVAAASMWGVANVAMRRMNQTTKRPIDAFAFMVWMSVVPPLPLFALSVIVEGWSEDLRAIRELSPAGAGSLAYIAYVSTLLGFGVWGWLIRRYEAGTVAVYSLLVPPFGIASAVLLLGEQVSAVRMAGAALVIAGVGLASVRRRPDIPVIPPPEYEPVPAR